jgi:hypothetical protein
MGPITDASFDRLWLRPFRTSATFARLAATRQGVFHIVDDVELLARAAIGRLEPPPATIPCRAVEGEILADACRWYAFRVEAIDDATERSTLACRVVDRGVLREFLGFNRAKHAVVEAAILATRIGFLDPGEIDAELSRLAPLVAKTGAAAEARAFELLRSYIRSPQRPESP